MDQHSDKTKRSSDPEKDDATAAADRLREQSLHPDSAVQGYGAQHRENLNLVFVNEYGTAAAFNAITSAYKPLFGASASESALKAERVFGISAAVNASVPAGFDLALNDAPAFARAYKNGSSGDKIRATTNVLLDGAILMAGPLSLNPRYSRTASMIAVTGSTIKLGWHLDHLL